MGRTILFNYHFSCDGCGKETFISEVEEGEIPGGWIEEKDGGYCQADYLYKQLYKYYCEECKC